MLQEDIGQLKSMGVVLGCTALCAAICALMAVVGPTFSYELFYLFPVMLAAWWGRFTLGVCLTLEITLLGYYSRHQSWSGISSAPHFLDEILRFCFYILVCSLVCRFRQTVITERTQARTDSLTGAANGRVFYEVLNAEIKRFSSHGQPFTLAYIDLDNFKKVNDQLGHAVGDQILKAVVDTTLKNTRRGSDTIARLGGDEFALILSETPAALAHGVMEKLRQTLLKEMAERGWPVTFSIGAMTFCDIPGDVEVLIQKVDSLMYQVKRKGKNHLRFEVLEETVEQKQTPSDRRASIRVSCSRPVRLNTLETGKQRTWQAKTLDISATGLLFQSEKEFPKDTVIIVAPTGPVAGVMAKVVRTIKDSDGFWLHGCKLAQLLSMEDLQKWLEPGEHVASKSPAVSRW